MKHLWIGGIALLFFSVIASAQTPPSGSIADRLTALEETAARQSATLAQIASLMEELRREFQNVTGQIDAAAHVARSSDEKLNRYSVDIDQRLRAMEERLAVFEKQITAAVGKLSPTGGKEIELYQAALDKIKSVDYLNALADLKNFGQKHPKSVLMDRVQYWIGENYFALKDYQKAIKEFQTLIDHHPKSEKIPVALLRQGESFMQLGLKEEARLFLHKVIEAYPPSPEAAKAKTRLTELAQPEKKSAPMAASPASGEIPLAPGVPAPAKQP